MPASLAMEMPAVRMTTSSLLDASPPSPRSEPINAAMGSISKASCGNRNPCVHQRLWNTVIALDVFELTDEFEQSRQCEQHQQDHSGATENSAHQVVGQEPHQRAPRPASIRLCTPFCTPSIANAEKYHEAMDPPDTEVRSNRAIFQPRFTGAHEIEIDNKNQKADRQPVRNVRHVADCDSAERQKWPESRVAMGMPSRKCSSATSSGTSDNSRFSVCMARGFRSGSDSPGSLYGIPCSANSMTLKSRTCQVCPRSGGRCVIQSTGHWGHRCPAAHPGVQPPLPRGHRRCAAARIRFRPVRA